VEIQALSDRRENVPSHLREAFRGFVQYREAISAFPYTQFSVPSFLSGRLYDNSVEKDAFWDEIFRGHNILNTAAEQGLRVDLLIGHTYLTDRMANTRHSNIVNIDAISVPPSYRETARLADLSLFRAAPHFVKKLVTTTSIGRSRA
jgi:hypothetical protein